MLAHRNTIGIWHFFIDTQLIHTNIRIISVVSHFVYTFVYQVGTFRSRVCILDYCVYKLSYHVYTLKYYVCAIQCLVCTAVCTRIPDLCTSPVINYVGYDVTLIATL